MQLNNSVSTDEAPQVTGFGLSADWMSALHGAHDFQPVLENLVKLLRADAAVIARATTPTGRLRTVAQYDVQMGKILTEPPRSYFCDILKDARFSARAGTFWTLSEAIETDGGFQIPADGAPHGLVHLKEVVILTLDVQKSHTDYVELQFRSAPLDHNLDLFRMMAGTLVMCWRRRVPGVVEKTLQRSRLRAVSKQQLRGAESLLGCDNMARLSRSEFRVCSMLRDGMTVTVIAKALSLSKSTIRCHLSSIFAKTETSCQVELLALLNAMDRPDSRGAATERQVS